LSSILSVLSGSPRPRHNSSTKLHRRCDPPCKTQLELLRRSTGPAEPAQNGITNCHPTLELYKWGTRLNFLGLQLAAISKVSPFWKGNSSRKGYFSCTELLLHTIPWVFTAKHKKKTNADMPEMRKMHLLPQTQKSTQLVGISQKNPQNRLGSLQPSRRRTTKPPRAQRAETLHQGRALVHGIRLNST